MPTTGRPTVAFVAALETTLRHFVEPIAQELTRRQYRCIAVVGDRVASGSVGTFEKVHHLRSFRRSGPSTLASSAVRLQGILRAERVSIAHLHTPYAVAVGRVAARLARIPHIAVIHGTLFDTSSSNGKLFRAVEAATARLSPTYITLNEDDQRSYKQIAPRSRVSVAPCGGAGVNLEKFSKPATSRRSAERGKTMLVMGRLTAEKGLDLSVDAWRLARTSIPDLKLRFVGSTHPGEPAWQPPRDEQITTSPWTNDPAAELAAADIVVSTSPREGFSMVTAEALLCGTPVVAVSNRGTRRVATQIRRGLTLVDSKAEYVAAGIVNALQETSVEVPSDTLHHWSQASVVRFHVAEITSLLDAK